jgi:hypothetical protein
MHAPRGARTRGPTPGLHIGAEDREHIPILIQMKFVLQIISMSRNQIAQEMARTLSIVVVLVVVVKKTNIVTSPRYMDHE